MQIEKWRPGLHTVYSCTRVISQHDFLHLFWGKITESLNGWQTVLPLQLWKMFESNNFILVLPALGVTHFISQLVDQLCTAKSVYILKLVRLWALVIIWVPEYISPQTNQQGCNQDKSSCFLMNHIGYVELNPHLTFLCLLCIWQLSKKPQQNTVST